MVAVQEQRAVMPVVAGAVRPEQGPRAEPAISAEWAAEEGSREVPPAAAGRSAAAAREGRAQREPEVRPVQQAEVAPLASRAREVAAELPGLAPPAMRVDVAAPVRPVRQARAARPVRQARVVKRAPGGSRTFVGSCLLGTSGTPGGVCFDLYDTTSQQAMDDCSTVFGGTWRGTDHCSTAGTDHCCTTAPSVDACYYVTGTCNN
jgi:hypothetical protein